MRSIVIGLTALMVGICSGVNVAQTLKPRHPGGTQQNVEVPTGKGVQQSVDDVPMAIPMNLKAGTPIKVAIDSEIRIREVGQTIQGRTAEPVYVFDKLVIPAKTVVNGQVSAIDGVSKMARTAQALNANFSPARSLCRIWILWSRHVYLLSLSGSRTRCGLSEEYGSGDRARNARQQIEWAEP